MLMLKMVWCFGMAIPSMLNLAMSLALKACFYAHLMVMKLHFILRGTVTSSVDDDDCKILFTCSITLLLSSIGGKHGPKQ